MKVLESFFAHLHLFIGRTIYNFYACATTSNCHRSLIDVTECPANAHLIYNYAQMTLICTLTLYQWLKVTVANQPATECQMKG